MRPSGNVRVQKAQRIFDAELKRAFAVSGFVGTFCVVAATFTSFYISSAAALTVAFGFCSVTGCLFIIFNALGKKIAKIFLAAFIGASVCMSAWLFKYINYGKQRNALCDGEKHTVRLVMTDDGRKTLSGYYLYPAKPESAPLAGEITVITREPLECPVFTAIEGEFKFSAPEGKYTATNYASSTVASVFIDAKKASFSEADGFIFSKAIYSARKYIEKNIEAVAEKKQGFLKALILGRKQEMSLRQREALSDAGLSHIVAVSGLHISVFIAFLSKLFSFVRNRFIRNITFILAVFLLAAVCGFTSSVVRAALMSALAFSGNLLRRKSDNLNNLGVAALIIVIAAPLSAVSASFLLSFGATLGIILLAEKFSVLSSTAFFRLTKHYPNRVFRFFSGLFCTSIAAFFFTFPLLYYFFGGQSFISVFSNIVCLPIVSILYPCAVAAVLLEMTRFLHPLAAALGYACDKMTELLMFFVFRLVRLRRLTGDMGITEYAISVASSAAVYGIFKIPRKRTMRSQLAKRNTALTTVAPALTFLILITLFSIF
jgi:ComEC/Rec2-like protein